MIRVIRSSILILLTIIASAMISTTAVYADATHVVRPGETLGAIAARYGISLVTIQAANGLSNPNQIIAGMMLIIPGATGGSASPSYGYNPPTTNASPRQGGGYTSPTNAGCTNPYRVQPGDTLSGVATRCGVSPSTLAGANGLSPYVMLTVGQILSIPAAGGYTPPSSGRAAATAVPTRSTYHQTLPATGGDYLPPATPAPPRGRSWVAGPTPTPRIEPTLTWR